MHPHAFLFCMQTLIRVGVAGKRILDIGSLDVNATAQGLSLRALCVDAEAYVGIDTADGPGVDVVSSAADYPTPPIGFDIVISTEALEHTPDPESIIDCAWRSLLPGGLLVVTAAGPGRAPHGCAGGAVGDEYYKNVAPIELHAWLAAWDAVQVSQNVAAHDVYAIATRPQRKDS